MVELKFLGHQCGPEHSFEGFAARASRSFFRSEVIDYVAKLRGAGLPGESPFVESAGPIDEVSIGHALIADALELGMAETVKRYLSLCFCP